jgi:hypothetical protein
MRNPCLERLPTQGRGEYVNAIVRFALANLGEFAELLAELVADKYVQNPDGERFIIDPERSDQLSVCYLFLDEDSQLVSVKNPITKRVEHPEYSLGILLIESYQSYCILTGPYSGKRFNRHSRPLPAEPLYRPGVVSGSISPARALGVNTVPAEMVLIQDKPSPNTVHLDI